MVKIVEKLLRAGEGRTVKRLENIAGQVNAIEEDFAKLTDAELRAETDKFKQRLAKGETLDDLLPEAFAAVREASKRTTPSVSSGMSGADGIRAGMGPNPTTRGREEGTE